MDNFRRPSLSSLLMAANSEHNIALQMADDADLPPPPPPPVLAASALPSASGASFGSFHALSSLQQQQQHALPPRLPAALSLQHLAMPSPPPGFHATSSLEDFGSASSINNIPSSSSSGNGNKVAESPAPAPTHFDDSVAQQLFLVHVRLPTGESVGVLALPSQTLRQGFGHITALVGATMHTHSLFVAESGAASGQACSWEDRASLLRGRTVSLIVTPEGGVSPIVSRTIPKSVSTNSLATAAMAINAARDPSPIPIIHDHHHHPEEQAAANESITIELDPQAQAEALASKLRKRTAIAKEILSTEQTYVRALETLITCYLNPMRHKKVLPAEDIAIIFSNVESIVGVNNMLALELEEVIQSWDPLQTRLGSIFRKLGPFMKLYVNYCNNHSHAMVMLQRYLKKSETLRTFLKRQQVEAQTMSTPSSNKSGSSSAAATTAASSVVSAPVAVSAHAGNASISGNGILTVANATNTALDSLLLMPVQRIPRYQLLLDDLVENTPADHEDFADLTTAVALIKTLGFEINEAIRRIDNEIKMANIEKMFASDNLVLIDSQYRLLDLNTTSSGSGSSNSGRSRGGSDGPAPDLEASGGSGSAASSPAPSRGAHSGRLLGKLMGRQSSSEPQLANANSGTNVAAAAGGDGVLTLSAPPRQFVQEGFFIVTDFGQHERFLLLFTDMLIVAKVEKNTTFRVKDKLMLSQMWVANYEQEDPFSFIMGWPQYNCSLTAASAKDKDLWFGMMQKQIADEKARDTTLARGPVKIHLDDSVNALGVRQGALLSKSILMTNTDTTRAAIEMALRKYDLKEDASQFQLWEYLNGAERLVHAFECPLLVFAGMEAKPKKDDAPPPRLVLKRRDPNFELPMFMRPPRQRSHTGNRSVNSLGPGDDLSLNSSTGQQSLGVPGASAAFSSRTQRAQRAVQQSTTVIPPSGGLLDVSAAGKQQAGIGKLFAGRSVRRRSNSGVVLDGDGSLSPLDLSEDGSSTTASSSLASARAGSSSPSNSSPVANVSRDIPTNLFGLPLYEIVEHDRLHPVLAEMLGLLYAGCGSQSAIFNRNYNLELVRDLRRTIDAEIDVDLRVLPFGVLVGLFLEFLQALPDSVYSGLRASDFDALRKAPAPPLPGSPASHANHQAKPSSGTTTTAASFFKSGAGELPPGFSAALESATASADKVAVLQRIVNRFPHCNYVFLQCTMSLLHKIFLISAENASDTVNIALRIGPPLKKEGLHEFIRVLIEYAPDVFGHAGELAMQEMMVPQSSMPGIALPGMTALHGGGLPAPNAGLITMVARSSAGSGGGKVPFARQSTKRRPLRVKVMPDVPSTPNSSTSSEVSSPGVPTSPFRRGSKFASLTDLYNQRRHSQLDLLQGAGGSTQSLSTWANAAPPTEHKAVQVNLLSRDASLASVVDEDVVLLPPPPPPVEQTPNVHHHHHHHKSSIASIHTSSSSGGRGIASYNSAAFEEALDDLPPPPPPPGRGSHAFQDAHVGSMSSLESEDTMSYESDSNELPAPPPPPTTTNGNLHRRTLLQLAISEEDLSKIAAEIAAADPEPEPEPEEQDVDSDHVSSDEEGETPSYHHRNDDDELMLSFNKRAYHMSSMKVMESSTPDQDEFNSVDVPHAPQSQAIDHRRGSVGTMMYAGHADDEGHAAFLSALGGRIEAESANPLFSAARADVAGDALDDDLVDESELSALTAVATAAATAPAPVPAPIQPPAEVTPDRRKSRAIVTEL